MSQMHKQTEFRFTKNQVSLIKSALGEFAKQHKGKPAHAIRVLRQSVELQERRIERNGGKLDDSSREE